MHQVVVHHGGVSQGGFPTLLTRTACLCLGGEVPQGDEVPQGKYP
jgi:hypothetical protein